MTGFGEIVRWYNNKRIRRIPDFVYRVLKHLTLAVESLYFKATMSECCICVLALFMYHVCIYMCMDMYVYMYFTVIKSNQLLMNITKYRHGFYFEILYVRTYCILKGEKFTNNGIDRLLQLLLMQ